MPAKREMHGLSWGPDGKRTPLHRLWLSIRNRCNNPETPDYPYYGGRGIKVCVAWDRFVQFAADVGPHPGRGLTLDRIDTDGDYAPGNVRWATREAQSRNRNYCKLDKSKAAQIIEMYAGGPKNGGMKQTDIAIIFGVSSGAISHVVRGKTWQ